MNVIRLRLTPDQFQQLAPLVLEGARNHQNVIFLAVTVPSWSPEEGSTVWDMEVITITAELGLKVKRLILSGSNP
jgi:hypothetical protein